VAICLVGCSAGQEQAEAGACRCDGTTEIRFGPPGHAGRISGGRAHATGVGIQCINDLPRTAPDVGSHGARHAQARSCRLNMRAHRTWSSLVRGAPVPDMLVTAAGIGYPLELVAGLRTLECPMSVMTDSYKAGHFLMYPEAKRCVPLAWCSQLYRCCSSFFSSTIATCKLSMILIACASSELCRLKMHSSCLDLPDADR